MKKGNRRIRVAVNLILFWFEYWANIWKQTKSILLTLRAILYSVFSLALAYIRIELIKKIGLKITRLKKPLIFSNDSGTFIVPSIAAASDLTPSYEKEIKNVIEKNASEFKKEKDKIFVNIGANLGIYVMLCSNKYNYISHGFEPVKEIFKLLQANVILSNCQEKVKLYNTALGNYKGKIGFDFCNGSEGNSKINTKGKYQVDIDKFDNIKIDIHKIRLIVIDVEGSEYDVLLGMKSSLKKIEAVDIVVEIWDYQKNKTKILEMMISLGYTITQVDDNNWLFSKRKK